MACACSHNLHRLGCPSRQGPKQHLLAAVCTLHFVDVHAQPLTPLESDLIRLDVLTTLFFRL